MKVKVKHIITEAKYDYELDGTTTLAGHEVTLNVQYSRDGHDWRTVCATRRWVPGPGSVSGQDIAQAVQTEFQARIDGAEDKIAELRAIRAKGG